MTHETSTDTDSTVFLNALAGVPAVETRVRTEEGVHLTYRIYEKYGPHHAYVTAGIVPAKVKGLPRPPQGTVTDTGLVWMTMEFLGSLVDGDDVAAMDVRVEDALLFLGWITKSRLATGPDEATQKLVDFYTSWREARATRIIGEVVIGSTQYAMVNNMMHVMVPPDVHDLRWTCSRRHQSDGSACRWTSSAAFTTLASFMEHHVNL